MNTIKRWKNRSETLKENSLRKKLCWLKCWPEAKSHCYKHIVKSCVCSYLYMYASCFYYHSMQLCIPTRLRWIIGKPPQTTLTNFTAVYCWPRQLKMLLFSTSTSLTSRSHFFPWWSFRNYVDRVWNNRVQKFSFK